MPDLDLLWRGSSEHNYAGVLLKLKAESPRLPRTHSNSTVETDQEEHGDC